MVNQEQISICTYLRKEITNFKNNNKKKQTKNYCKTENEANKQNMVAFAVIRAIRLSPKP